MNNTALGAVSNKKENIRFISEAHEKFYDEKLKEVRYVDVYHKALCYCLGISDDTRRNINRIYDFKTGCVKPECLHDGWQTSGSEKVVRMAFNLYCNGTPSVDDELDAEEQIDECRRYLDCQHFFRQIFLGYFPCIVQVFDIPRKNVCGDDYTSLHNPIVLSSVLLVYGMFHSTQILF